MLLQFDLQIGNTHCPVECTRSSCTIGRGENADVVVSGDERRLTSVAEHHCRVTLVDKHPVIEDLKSSHGTWVNGKSVVTPVKLKLGDRISLGRLGPALTLKKFEPVATPAPRHPAVVARPVVQPVAPPQERSRKIQYAAVIGIALAAGIASVLFSNTREEPQETKPEAKPLDVAAGSGVRVTHADNKPAGKSDSKPGTEVAQNGSAPLLAQNERSADSKSSETPSSKTEKNAIKPEVASSNKLEEDPLPAVAPEPLPGHYALLIGVKLYGGSTGLRPLKFAESDVEELRNTLVRRIGYLPENVHVLSKTEEINQQDSELNPTRSNVMKRLSRILDDRKPDDSVLIAFAGHGLQFTGGEDFFFCPSDAAMTADGKSFDKSTLLAQSEIYKVLKASKAGVKLLISDACRDDPISGATRSRMSVDLDSVTRPQSAKPPQDVAAIFSCSEAETAHEDDKLGHGVFFHFFIRALRGDADKDGDGVVTIKEIEDFASPQVTNYVLQRFGKRQTPQLKSDLQRRDAALFQRK